MWNISFALSLDRIGCSTFSVYTYILTSYRQIAEFENWTDRGIPCSWRIRAGRNRKSGRSCQSRRNGAEFLTYISVIHTGAKIPRPVWGIFVPEMKNIIAERTSTSKYF